MADVAADACTVAADAFTVAADACTVAADACTVAALAHRSAAVLKLAREHAHANDARVRFNEEDHTYFVDGELMALSVTGLVHTASPDDFEPDAVIQKMKAGRNWPNPNYSTRDADGVLAGAELAAMWAALSLPPPAAAPGGSGALLDDLWGHWAAEAGAGAAGVALAPAAAAEAAPAAAAAAAVAGAAPPPARRSHS